VQAFHEFVLDQVLVDELSGSKVDRRCHGFADRVL
jgi:hypothetical protein